MEIEFDVAIKLQLILGWVIDAVQIFGIIGIIIYLSRRN